MLKAVADTISTKSMVLSLVNAKMLVIFRWRHSKITMMPSTLAQLKSEHLVNHSLLSSILDQFRVSFLMTVILVQNCTSLKIDKLHIDNRSKLTCGFHQPNVIPSPAMDLLVWITTSTTPRNPAPGLRMVLDSKFNMALVQWLASSQSTMSTFLPPPMRV